MNGLGRPEAEKIVLTWLKLGERWAAAAPGALRDVVGPHGYNPSTLAREAGTALRNALYERVRVTVHGRQGLFEATTAGNARIKVPFSKGTLKSVFEEHLIDAYLRNNAISDDDEHLERIGRACRMGASRRTVYERTHVTLNVQPLENGQSRRRHGAGDGRPPERPGSGNAGTTDGRNA